jgi:hypothetical protein
MKSKLLVANIMQATMQFGYPNKSRKKYLTTPTNAKCIEFDDQCIIKYEKNELQNQVLKHHSLTKINPSAQLQKHITKTYCKHIGEKAH